MMPRLSDLGRNVMDRDDPVEDHDNDKTKQSECEIVQEWIAYHSPHSLILNGLVVRPTPCAGRPIVFLL
jgi:hypothetical protein